VRFWPLNDSGDNSGQAGPSHPARTLTVTVSELRGGQPEGKPGRPAETADRPWTGYPGVVRLGALAQLVEHLLCKQRVTGSNPVGSTKATTTTRSLSFSNLGLIAQLVRARA
jgi:hypothetical protein